MKYIAYFEFSPADYEEIKKRDMKVFAEYQKGSKKFPRAVFGPYAFIGEPRGFLVVDTDDPEQLLNLAYAYGGMQAWSFFPIHSVMKSRQIFDKMNK